MSLVPPGLELAPLFVGVLEMRPPGGPRGSALEMKGTWERGNLAEGRGARGGQERLEQGQRRL